jgi:hypothetical protein
MRFRGNLLVALVLGVSTSAHAQLTQDARFSILAGLIATEGAARIPMPLGKNGVDLSENGLYDQGKLQKEIANNGQAITPGKIVTITAIEFGDKTLEFELNNGGTKKKSILSRISVNAGGGVSSSQQDPNAKPEAPAIGSKITLKFSSKISPNLTVEQLKDLLNPVIDFSKQSTARGDAETLPPEFRDAIARKEALAGMDGNTVILALGQPNKRVREKNEKGVEQEDWIYIGRGRKQTFVTFEKDVVVSIKEYQ